MFVVVLACGAVMLRTVHTSLPARIVSILRTTAAVIAGTIIIIHNNPIVLKW